MRKGEVVRLGNFTVAHRVKPGCAGKLVWSKEINDWVMPDPKKNLSDEILVKWRNTDSTGSPF